MLEALSGVQAKGQPLVLLHSRTASCLREMAILAMAAQGRVVFLLGWMLLDAAALIPLLCCLCPGKSWRVSRKHLWLPSRVAWTEACSRVD